MTQTIKTLEEQTRYCLSNYPETRNSDIALWNAIVGRLYRHLTVNGEGLYISLAVMYDLPNQDNVKRVRARLQNELKLYLPTDEQVAVKRGWKREEWREYLRQESGERPKLTDMKQAGMFSDTETAPRQGFYR